MSQLILVGEDALCCALGLRLVAHTLPAWTVAIDPINAGGVTKLIPELPRYQAVAQHGQSVLCIADSDQHCPVTLVTKWLAPYPSAARFVLRLAVREAESWVLADRAGMNQHFKVPVGKLPHQPDELVDPKTDLLRYLAKYAPMALRREMVARSGASLRRGVGYNAGLRSFVASTWGPERAAGQSPSLQRALIGIAGLAGQAHD